MDRLQLYINISREGFNQITSINADEAVRQHVCDLSEAIEGISYDPEQKNIFYLIRYTDQGCFIVVLRTIPDRLGDHLAAWIYVPSNIIIDDDRIMAVVDRVKATVLNPQVTQRELDELRSVFADTYEVEHMPGAVVANQGETHAHRFYGGDTDCRLVDLIGSKRYQTSYLPFADVILADKGAAVRISGPNLTHTPLYQMVKIYPPRLGDGPYHPRIFGQPFDRPFLAPLMGTVEILWLSDKQVDIHRSVMIGQANMRIDDINANHQDGPNQLQAPAPSDSHPAPSADQATGQTPGQATGQTPGQATDQATDQVGDQVGDQVAQGSLQSKATTSMTSLCTHPVSTADQAPDQVTKAATPSTHPAPSTDRHGDNDTPTDHRHGTQRYYKFEIPASSAAISGMIEFDVHTHSSIDSSPIDGYVCDSEIVDGNRVNYLRYAPKPNLQTQLTWAAIGALAGVLLTLLCVWIFSGSGSDAGTEATPNDSIQVESPVVESAEGAQSATEGAVPEQNVDRSLVGAVNYLDTNKKWTRSELEAYPDLKGLYDDMNNFRRERLYGHWAEKLKESRSFAKIAEHARAGKHKKPRVKPGQTTFNTGNDQTINTRSYLNTIDP